MRITIPLSMAALLAVGIIIIGSLYIVSPEKMTGSFGLKLPASDSDTRAWLRLKGIRDIVSGLVVLTLIVTTNPRTVGIAFLVESLTAFGDMSNVLGSGGSKRAAFSIHGATFAVMVITGLFLVDIF
jgi:hypothetical protein